MRFGDPTAWSINERSGFPPSLPYPSVKGVAPNATTRVGGWKIVQARISHLRGNCLFLEPSVRVDTRDVIDTARRLVQPNAAWSESDLDPTRFKGDLLPDWYAVDDWVIVAYILQLQPAPHRRHLAHQGTQAR